MLHTSEAVEHSIVAIERQIDQVDNSLDEYFATYNVEQLQHDLKRANKQHEESIISINDSKSKLKLKESSLSGQDKHEAIEICNQLWVINGLVGEVEHSTNFETKVMNFAKSRARLEDLKNARSIANNVNDILILGKLEEKLHQLKQELIELSKRKLDRFFYIDDTLGVIFTEKDDEGLVLRAYLNASKKLYEESLASAMYLNRKFDDWTSKTLHKLGLGYRTEVSKVDSIIKLKLVDGEYDFLNFTKSVEQIITFFNDITGFTGSLHEMNSLKAVIGKNILRTLKTKMFQKENVYPLIIDKLNYDEHADSKNSEVSTIRRLYQISNLLSGEGWSQDSISELEFWIDDLTTAWVENEVDCTMDNLKDVVLEIVSGEYESLFSEESLITQSLITASLATETKGTSDSGNTEWNNEDWDEKDESEDETDIKESKAPKSLAEEDVDDGGWGDEDLDLDLDSIKSKSKKSANEDNGEDEDGDGWDAWNEELSIGEIEENPTNLPEPVSKKSEETPSTNNTVPFYRFTKLTEKVLAVIEEFMKSHHDLQSFNIDGSQVDDSRYLFHQGLKKLVTAYFMMLEPQVNDTYKCEVLFYNDFNRISEQCHTRFQVDLTSCAKLGSDYINSYTGSMDANLLKIIGDYDSSIWRDNDLDNDSTLKRYEQELLIRFDSQLDEIKLDLQKIAKLNSQVTLNTVITIIFQALNVICDKILSRKDISSYESDIFADIITEITHSIFTKFTSYNINLAKIQSFEKLQQVKLVLVSNLQGILNAFYDARLYELETHEITSLIESLFVESAKRDSAVAEIRSIRETQL